MSAHRPFQSICSFRSPYGRVRLVCTVCVCTGRVRESGKIPRTPHSPLLACCRIKCLVFCVMPKHRHMFLVTLTQRFQFAPINHLTHLPHICSDMFLSDLTVSTFLFNLTFVLLTINPTLQLSVLVSLLFQYFHLLWIFTLTFLSHYHPQC